MSISTVPTIDELAERVAALEDELARLIQRRDPLLKKGWQNAIGMYGDDPGMKEMLELGRQIRAADLPDDSP